MTLREALDYEVRSSWWAHRISWGWAQALSSRWFAFKVGQKWFRYAASLDADRIVKEYRASQKALPSPTSSPQN